MEHKTLTYITLLAALPQTPEWSYKVALVMISCNLFAIAIGYYAIQNRGVGPKLPVGVPAMFTGFGIPELLATMSFGHLLGAGFILGLGNAGLL
jgi:photosystem I subunit X